jgi:hypothetical protein
MMALTENEMKAVLAIVKSPEKMYNANSLSKAIGITSMGTLKILKRLEKQSILKSKEIGKSRIYNVADNSYARNYIGFLLSKEQADSPAFVKRWINEIKKIKSADLSILFGSAIRKADANDIDVLFVTDQKRFARLKKEVDEVNKINIKKIHPLYQTQEDIISNIKKGTRSSLM